MDFMDCSMRKDADCFFDILKMTEKQRKATFLVPGTLSIDREPEIFVLSLKDGQDAGDMLLDIEGRIGEIALKEEKAKPPQTKSGKFTVRETPIIPKHERLRMNKVRMENSQQISKNPKIVERVKAQARENEDIKKAGKNLISRLNYLIN